jgi:DNA-binding transcriptional ArsR family regulator
MRNNGHRGNGHTKVDIFRGFADPARLAILDCLRDGPRTAREITAFTGIAQADAAGLLDHLQECGLVRRDEKNYALRYRLSDVRVGRMLQAADFLFARKFKGIPDPSAPPSADRS